MLFMTFAIAAVLSAAAGSTVHARNIAGAGADANECVQVTWEMRSTASMIWTRGDHKYWYLTVRNTCPHAIEFYYCFFRQENSTCSTRNAYYENVRTIDRYQKYEFRDPNQIWIWPQRKNTVRLEWLACPRSNKSGFPQPGLWPDARTCRG